MKRNIPLLITAVAGIVLILAVFVPALQKFGEMAAVWFDILAAIAFILGGGNLIKLQLKKISDRQPGWGYAAITLACFVVTLWLGLFKVGSAPAPNTEYYGVTFVPLAVSELPEFAVPGRLATRADRLPLPTTVRNQIRSDDSRIYFRGWLRSDQFQDLIDYQDDLPWRATVEELRELATPPAAAGSVTYYPADRALAFAGAMNEQQRVELHALFADSPLAQAAVDRLNELSQRQITLTGLVAGEPPITLTGPMSPDQRDELYRRAPGMGPVRAVSTEERSELLMRLEQAGAALTNEQRQQFELVFARLWTAESLVAAIHTAGIESPRTKSYRQLLAEQQAGVTDLVPQLPAPAPVVLNVAQLAAVQQFAAEGHVSVDSLVQQLRAAGPLTAPMTRAVDDFLRGQPTVGERLYELWLALRTSGPLTVAQEHILLDEYRQQYAWKQAVDSAFLQSQQVKYSWSGDYAEQGSPFWWIYQYTFEPLLTTTFALLAFYVASAAFRAFRAKNLEASLLLGTAFIILLGRTFAGYLLTAWIPESLSAFKIDQLSVYIMAIVNTGGNRAIMIGIALGIASTSLKVLLGIDRSYLGSSDD